MAAYGLLIALTLVMKLAPDSTLGRWLVRHCVERPMDMLGRMQRHHLIFAVLLLGLIAVGSELIVALGTADLFVLYALDLSLYIDGLLVTMALASMARTRSGLALVRAGTSHLAARLRRVFGQRRRRRPADRRSRGNPSNDDDPAPAWALAA